jgi:hypothetical protein
MDNTNEPNPPKLYHLDFFEEAVGILHELTENEGILVADVGKVHLTLPLKLKESLWPLVGQRISILHTDLPKKEYLYRVLS